MLKLFPTEVAFNVVEFVKIVLLQIVFFSKPRRLFYVNFGMGTCVNNLFVVLRNISLNLTWVELSFSSGAAQEAYMARDCESYNTVKVRILKNLFR